MKRKLVIDRSKWQCCDHEDGFTYMLNDVGRMCCLGFYCKSLGYPNEQLLNISTPAEMLNHSSGEIEIHEGLRPLIDQLLSSGNYIKSFLGSQLIGSNDGVSIDKNREDEIKTLFAKMDVEVEFVGEY